MVLATGSLVADLFGPSQPARYAGLVHEILVLYLIFSLVDWVVVKTGPRVGSAFQLGTHGADILWAAALTLFSEGPSSPFFLFFVFMQLVAAYRWGYRGTLLTTLAGMGVLFGEAHLLTPITVMATAPASMGSLVSGTYGMNRLILRSIDLVLVGFLLGYLAEGVKTLQAEAALIAQVISKGQVGVGLRPTLDGMLEEVLRFFGARRVLVAIEEVQSGRLFLWEAREPPKAGGLETKLREVRRQERASYLGQEEVQALYWQRGWLGGFGFLAVDSEGRRLRNLAPEAIESMIAVIGANSALAASFRLRNEWHGRFFLMDPQPWQRWGNELEFLREVVAKAAPVAYNAYLLTRIRSQIGAAERGRLARELHDGAIQSLVAAEMQMEVLRRQASGSAPEQTGYLKRVQELVHEQVLNLRELMEEIKPIDLDPRRLARLLAERVEKFERETGIESRFCCEGPPVELTGRACQELFRILQEALFNVRRHSGARRVEVRLSRQDGRCKLEVADDGRGFDFTGRMNQAALEMARKGPQVIQQRLRALGGELVVESHPGKGARLEIFLPQKEA
jgi:signal transduction histidine kinase